MENKKVIAYINAENEAADSVVKRSADYEQNGADWLFLYNYSMVEAEREEFLHVVRQVAGQADIPIIIGCYIKRLEDIKKALYTGAAYVATPYAKLSDFSVLKQGSDRFGKDKLIVELDASMKIEDFHDSSFNLNSLADEMKSLGVAMLLIKHITITDGVKEKLKNAALPVLIRDSLLRNDMETLLSMENVAGVATDYYEKKDILKIKAMLKQEGIPVETLEGEVCFSQMKTDANGLVPVIVQDYKNNEVLMLAYMNEEAYNKTMETGRMTYYSRSRKKLWVKGKESGHFQYVRSLSIDCDSDTILAKVHQIGAACHTGNRSCFYRSLLRRHYEEANLATVFQEVFQVILDRKEHPKEGSYTNYLFDKGIDKILKKCGEEATEIVIAAKNPDSEEVKYEIVDFLYHLMVLMAEKGLNWDDITKELSHRR